MEIRTFEWNTHFAFSRVAVISPALGEWIVTRFEWDIAPRNLESKSWGGRMMKASHPRAALSCHKRRDHYANGSRDTIERNARPDCSIHHARHSVGKSRPSLFGAHSNVTSRPLGESTLRRLIKRSSFKRLWPTSTPLSFSFLFPSSLPLFARPKGSHFESNSLLSKTPQSRERPQGVLKVGVIGPAPTFPPRETVLPHVIGHYSPAGNSSELPFDNGRVWRTFLPSHFALAAP